jgi:hypothetical protein
MLSSHAIYENKGFICYIIPTVKRVIEKMN